MDTVGFFQAEDPGDVRVIERGQNFSLPLKADQPLLVIGKTLRQHLDGHVPVQLGVSGSEDFSHTALAKLGRDFVVGEGGVDH